MTALSYSFGKMGISQHLKYRLLFLILIIPSFTQAQDIKVINDTDYNEALTLLSELHSHFLKTFPNKEECKIAEAIVFGELIRYNKYQNMIETAALETFYIETGSDIVDFSIGKLQMKPSFIEKLEKELSSNKNIYSTENFNYLKNNDINLRKARLERMKKEDWQIKYLKVFINVMYQRLPKLKSVTRKDKLLLLSTAYNAGMQYTMTELYEISKKRTFPYGNIPLANNQLTYFEVAEKAYQSFIPTLF